MFSDMHEIACEFGELSGLAGGVGMRLAQAVVFARWHEQALERDRADYATNPHRRAAVAATKAARKHDPVTRVADLKVRAARAREKRAKRAQAKAARAKARAWIQEHADYVLQLRERGTAA